MDGQIVGISRVDIGPDIGSHEKALLEENAFVTRLAVRSRTFGVEMVEMQVGHIARISPAAQSLNQAVRHTGHAAQMHMTVGWNVADCLIGTDKTYILHLGIISIFAHKNKNK